MLVPKKGLSIIGLGYARQDGARNDYDYDSSFRKVSWYRGPDDKKSMISNDPKRCAMRLPVGTYPFNKLSGIRYVTR